MPFGLKNTEATYQMLVTKMFVEQIGKTMEVYVDDMLVKSIKARRHIMHLQGMFDLLREYRIALLELDQKNLWGLWSVTEE